MTEAPNTARVFELIHLFNEGVQNQESPDDLLQRALTAIAACVPGGQAARVYQLHRDTLSLWAGDDSTFIDPKPQSDDAPISINTHPVYAVVLRTLSPAHDADSGRVVFPLQRGTQVFGLVEVDTEERRIDLLPLHAAMNHIALALDNLILRDLLHRQNKAAHELASCTTFTDIAGAFARNMLESGQYIAINLFIHDADGEFAGFETVATANRRQTFASHDRIALTIDEFGHPLNRIYDPGIPVLVTDVLSESTIHERFRAWLQERNSTSFYGIPMWAQGEVIGYIALASTTTITDFTQAEMQAIRTLTDQISSLIYAQRIVRDVDETRLLIDNIAQTRQVITEADSYKEMAQAVLAFGASHLTAIGLTLFERGLTSDMQPTSRQTIVFEGNNGSIRVGDDFLTTVPDEDALATLHSRQPLILYQAATNPALNEATRRQLALVKARWMASFGLHTGHHLLGTMDIVSSGEHLLTQEQIEGYATLANQIAIAIHNQQTLEMAKNTEHLAAQIVATNREIALAETQTDMGKAVLRVMPDIIDAVTISTFNRPVTADEVPEAIVLDAIVQRDQTIIPAVIDEPATDNPNLVAVVNQLIDGDVFNNPNVDSYEAVMTPNALQVMKAHGIRSTMTIGMRSGRNLLGMLTFASNRPIDLMEQLQGNVRALADQFATTVENRNLFTQTAETLGFVHAQYETITRIHSADSPTQILQAIYEFVGSTYDHAHLARIVYPSQPMQAQILAQIDSKGVQAVDEVVPVNDYRWAEGLLALRETMIPDVTAEPDLDDPIRQQLLDNGIGAVLNLPLVANERLVGFVHFTNHTPTPISDEQMRALHGLANQIAIVLENEDLLKQTEESLSEASALYDVNRSLLEAQGMLDILSAIFRYIAPNSTSISYLEVVYNKKDAIEALQINHIVTPAGAKSVENPLQFPVDEAIRARLVTHWADMGNALEMIEDVQHEQADHPLASLPLMQGVGSVIIIPIQKQDTRVGQIHIVYDKPRAFDTRTQRLCQAVRNQVVIVQQNNDLLRDTQITASRLGEQVRVQQTLNQLGTVLNSLHDEYTLLSEACRALVDALDIDHAGMTLIDDDGLIATVMGEYPDNGTVGLEIEATGQIWDILRQSTDSFVINDVDNNPLLEPMSRAALQSIGVKSVMFVPINDQSGNLIGSVGLDIFTEDKVFDDNMTSIAQTITLQITLGIQNIRLLREAQGSAAELANRVQTLQALNETVTVLNSLRNESALLREVGRVLVNTVGVDHVGIAMLDTDGKHVTVTNEYPDHGLIGTQIAIGNDELQARLVKTLRPIVINNLPESNELSAKNRKTLVDVGVQAIMVFPVVDVNNHFIGSIGLDVFTIGREFDTEMISLASTIVTQISVSIQNIRLLESARKQATQLQQITAFSQSMQATLNITDIFRTAIEISRRVMPIDHMSIVLYDTEKAKLQVVAKFSTDGLQLDFDKPQSVSQSESVLLQRAWESRAMLHFDDLADQGGLQHPFDTQMRSALFLPLFSRGLMRGIVELSTRMPGAYNETDITVFRQMVNQLAVALENAEAYTQSQEIAKNRALVNEISGRLQQQVSLENILDVTVREVGKALGARRGRIRLGVQAENGETPQDTPEE